MKLKTFNPYESAVNKKYLVNLLTQKGKFANFDEAMKADPVLCELVARLKPHEVKLLIDRIEYNR